MNKKILICCIIIFTFIIIFVLYSYNKNLPTNNISEPFIQSTDINFVRTYSVDYILDYTDTTGEFGYIVVNQFQMDMPTVMKISVENLKDIKINNNYEFSFQGTKDNNKKYNTIYDIITNFKLTSIVPTDKIGLEQRQDEI